MKITRFLISLAALLALTFAMNNKLGMIPPLGKFLNPFGGFWQNAESEQVEFPAQLQFDALNEKVQIHFDDRMVPHIFAENLHDLYFIQGYVTAQHRLWQMEFQTMAAAGRLSEIIGEKAIPFGPSISDVIK